MYMSRHLDVYLFRHGEALNNVQSHIIGGRSGSAPLVEGGVRQAAILGETLRAMNLFPDEVYSSTAMRAQQTGQIALSAMGVRLDIKLDERLHEQDTGDWTGCLAADVFTEEMVRTIEATGKDFRSPNGESMNDVGSRMYDWAESLQSGTLDEPRIVFAFTHGGAIRSFASRLFEWSHAQTYQAQTGNTSVSIFSKGGDESWHMDALGIEVADLEVKGS